MSLNCETSVKLDRKSRVNIDVNLAHRIDLTAVNGLKRLNDRGDSFCIIRFALSYICCHRQHMHNTSNLSIGNLIPHKIKKLLS